MSRQCTVCCTVSLVVCFFCTYCKLTLSRQVFVLGNCRLRAWWMLKFKATVFSAFVIVLLLSYVEFVNTIICCFIWHCILFVLLILPQDPNNRSSSAETVEDAVCASPRITTSYNSPVGKVPEASVSISKHDTWHDKQQDCLPGCDLWKICCPSLCVLIPNFTVSYPERRSLQSPYNFKIS